MQLCFARISRKNKNYKRCICRGGFNCCNRGIYYRLNDFFTKGHFVILKMQKRTGSAFQFKIIINEIICRTISAIKINAKTVSFISAFSIRFFASRKKHNRPNNKKIYKVLLYNLTSYFVCFSVKNISDFLNFINFVPVTS